MTPPLTTAQAAELYRFNHVWPELRRPILAMLHNPLTTCEHVIILADAIDESWQHMRDGPQHLFEAVVADLREIAPLWPAP